MSAKIGDVERFRKALLDERTRIAHAIEYLHDEHPGSIEDETQEVPSSSDNHLAETATATVDREIDYSLEENAEQILAEVEAALGRIDDGTYGVCEACGQPIGEERLEALPWARLCIDDARKQAR